MLHGERVTGRYVLFQTGGKNWMIHRMDPPQDPGRELLPEGITPMLAKPSSLPANTDDWAFEIKWDGVRALASVQGGRVRLHGRSGLEMTATYPEVRGLGASLGMVECMLDGELVAFDDAGKPSFERLQQRINVAGDEPDRARRAVGPGHLPRVRPAVPRGPQHDVAALHRPPPPARGPAARRPLVVDAGIARRRGPPRCWSSRASSGLEGVIGKRARLEVRAGQAVRRVDQGQERAAHPARDRRLHARQGRPHRPHRRRRARRARRPTAPCAAPARRVPG